MAKLGALKAAAAATTTPKAEATPMTTTTPTTPAAPTMTKKEATAIKTTIVKGEIKLTEITGKSNKAASVIDTMKKDIEDYKKKIKAAEDKVRTSNNIVADALNDTKTETNTLTSLVQKHCRTNTDKADKAPAVYSTDPLKDIFVAHDLWPMNPETKKPYGLTKMAGLKDQTSISTFGKAMKSFSTICTRLTKQAADNFQPAPVTAPTTPAAAPTTPAEPKPPWQQEVPGAEKPTVEKAAPTTTTPAAAPTTPAAAAPTTPAAAPKPAATTATVTPIKPNKAASTKRSFIDVVVENMKELDSTEKEQALQTLAKDSETLAIMEKIVKTQTLINAQKQQKAM